MTLDEIARWIETRHPTPPGGTDAATMLREGYTFSVDAEQPEGWWSA
jgi:hypothetical protein